MTWQSGMRSSILKKLTKKQLATLKKELSTEIETFILDSKGGIVDDWIALLLEKDLAASDNVTFTLPGFTFSVMTILMKAGVIKKRVKE